jgi:tetraacyldisaccharide 4'-kinase
MDVALLDDGFQHWRLARDLDIVLVDATDPFGNDRLVPHGRLRESPGALARAGVIVITRADTIRAKDLRTLKDRITETSPNSVVALAKHLPMRVRVVGKEEVMPIDRLVALPIVGACGIGNPEGFRRTLDQSGADIRAFLAFPDHHRFTTQDLEMLQTRAKELNARAVVVTEKDAAKLVLLPNQTLPLWSLEVDFQIANGEAEVWSCIERALAEGDHRARG